MFYLLLFGVFLRRYVKATIHIYETRILILLFFVYVHMKCGRKEMLYICNVGANSALRRDRTRPRPPLERVDPPRANVCRRHFHVLKQKRGKLAREISQFSHPLTYLPSATTAVSVVYK